MMHSYNGKGHPGREFRQEAGVVSGERTRKGFSVARIEPSVETAIEDWIN
jgi:hypothetical protein